jgi:DNA-directed RNA polymerase subunit RPC12/RpoP
MSQTMGMWCPHCGVKFGHGETLMQKLEKQLAAERARLDQMKAARDHAERQVAAQKGQITKMRNRVGRGVCPCCNRFFVKLHQHVETKHPEFKEDA